ncbi:hypothetical protein ACULNC_27060 [Shigella flexneri]
MDNSLQNFPNRVIRAAQCGNLPDRTSFLSGTSDKLNHKVAKIYKCRTPLVHVFVAVVPDAKRA